MQDAVLPLAGGVGYGLQHPVLQMAVKLRPLVLRAVAGRKQVGELVLNAGGSVLFGSGADVFQRLPTVLGQRPGRVFEQPFRRLHSSDVLPDAAQVGVVSGQQQSIVRILSQRGAVAAAAVPVQVQQVLVAHAVDRVAGLGPVPMAGIYDAQRCPVGIVRHVGLAGGKDHNLKLVAAADDSTVSAGNGLPEQVGHQRGVGHYGVSGFQQLLHHIGVLAETLALGVGAVVHIDGPAQELCDGVGDDAEVVAFRREQGIGNLVGVQAVAVLGGDGAQQHRHGGGFGQVTVGFRRGAVAPQDVGLNGRIQLGEAGAVDYFAADARGTRGDVVGMRQRHRAAFVLHFQQRIAQHTQRAAHALEIAVGGQAAGDDIQQQRVKGVGVVKALIVQAGAAASVAGGHGGIGVGGVLPGSFVNAVEQTLAQDSRQVGFARRRHRVHHPPQLRVDPVQHIRQRQGVGVVSVAGGGRRAFLQQCVGILGGCDDQHGPGAVDHGVGQGAEGSQHSLRADASVTGGELVHSADVVNQFVDDDDHRLCPNQTPESVGTGVGQRVVAVAEVA